MDLSAEEAGILQEMDVTDQQLKDMVDHCCLRGILVPVEAENVCSFLDLIKFLCNLDRIGNKNLGLVKELLHTCRRHDLAKKIPNGIRRDINENSIATLADLQQQLRTGYQKVVNVFLHPNSSVPKKIGSFFCDVQLYHNQQQCQDGLREPLGSFKDLFPGGAVGSPRNRVMLKGKSASGKTTLLQKITEEWMENRLPAFDLLFFLPMGKLNPHWTLGEAVVKLLLPADTEVTAEQIDDIIQGNPSKVAVLFDGYDNFKADGAGEALRSSPTSPPVIADLISFRQLQDVYVLISTRSPGAREFSFQDEGCHVYQHVELYGFAERSIRQYVQMDVISEEKQHSLLTYLETNQLIALVRTPGFLQMLCHYWNTSSLVSTNPPEMLNVLFENMIYGLYKHPPQSPSGGEAPAQQKCAFSQIMPWLGKRAFDLLLKGRKVFPLSELKYRRWDEEDEACKEEEDKMKKLCFELGLLKLEDSVFQHSLGSQAFDDHTSTGSLRARLSETDEEEDESQHSPLSPDMQLVSFHNEHIFRYCVAKYLRGLAETNFASFEKKMKRLLRSFTKVAEVKHVFLFCLGKDNESDPSLNIKIGKFILDELNKVVRKAVFKLRDSLDVKTDIHISQMMNDYWKLCLHCNYEAQVAPSLNEELSRCFEGGVISLIGISEYTTRALAYFLKYSMGEKSPPSNDGVVFKFQLNSLKIISLGNEVSMVTMKEFCKHVPGAIAFFRSLMTDYLDTDPADVRSMREKTEREFGEVRYDPDLCEVKRLALLHFYQRIRRCHPFSNVIFPSMESAIKLQSQNLQDLSLMLPDIEAVAWNSLVDALSIGKFEGLKRLDLSFCSLTPAMLQSLASIFGKGNLLPQLRVLVLAGNRCNQLIVQSIRHLKNLREVGLQNCGLPEADLVTLLQSLSQLDNLEKIDLRRNNFTDQCASQLRALLRKATLKGLKLSLCDLQDKQGIRSLTNALRRQSSLEELHLNHCPDPLELISASKDILSNLPNLVDFRLSGSLPCFGDDETPLIQLPKLPSEVIKGFASNLKKLRKLETFSLLYCDLQEEDFMKIFHACDYLRRLPDQLLGLMRYSYGALSQDMSNRSLKRILSNEKNSDFLQLW